MKAMILFMLVTILSVLMSCCDKLFPDEKLSMQRKDYEGNKLRTDGYYYEVNKNVITLFFLYRNGIILYGYSHPNMNLDNIEIEMLNNDMYNGNKNKTRFGVFCIDGENIKIEKWEPSTGGGLPVYIREGNVLNDTTFHITIGYLSDGSNRRELNEIYHFREFSPKPDSTNVYIK